jgi:hypothetical protein
MTQSELGDPSSARATYDRGFRRMRDASPEYPPYIRLRTEAAGLLGIEP